MIATVTLKKSITIQAPVAEVWKALTDPDLIKQYFFGTNAISDWKEGSTLIFKGEWNGHAYEDHGKILQIEFQKMLRYSYWSSFSGLPDVPENYQVITYFLQPENVETVLT